MPNEETLAELKRTNLRDLDVQLAIVQEWKRQRVSHYNVKFVATEDDLKSRLRQILQNKIAQANVVEDYAFDCPDPEGDQVRAIQSAETDFSRILETVRGLNPEVDKIESEQELVKAKAYLIILRTVDEIKIAGLTTLPENWKLRHSKGLIPLLFKNNQFEDLEDENIFSISNSVDVLYFGGTLFILSKKNFEQALNFRDGMITRANGLYDEARALNLFLNLEILQERVGDNIRYLRKIATISNLGHYRNADFLLRMREVATHRGWGIEFMGNQIVISEDTLDDILTLLQDKRLRSEITEIDFDVESTKPVIVAGRAV